MADKDGGPLGYRRSNLAGSRRVVTRIEDRIFLGRFKQFATFGVAPFVNTGELWAGDVPFGTNTGVKYSAGISLLASVPPRSQRLWRLNLVFPIHPTTERNGRFVWRATTSRECSGKSQMMSREIVNGPYRLASSIGPSGSDHEAHEGHEELRLSFFFGNAELQNDSFKPR
jgi:hypothetical protein